MSADLAQQKKQLRERLRFRRQHHVANLDAMARLGAFRIVPSPLFDLLTDYRIIGAYASYGDEPDLFPMLNQRDELALPFFRERGPAMEFRAWRRDAPLEPGPWRVRQPAADSKPAQPALIFCPLLGFGRNGDRIGQGGGHYDRYFAANPDIVRIGIAWSVQEVDAIPVESTDMALDAVLTEQEFIRCGDRL